MAWRHYETKTTADCELLGPSGTAGAIIELGSVTTGKQRVWAGFFAKITAEGGTIHIGENPHSMRQALRAAADQAGLAGWLPLLVGVDENFYETGLSENTGYGYLRGRTGPFHMLDAPPAVLKIEAAEIEQAITEAEQDHDCRYPSGDGRRVTDDMNSDPDSASCTMCGDYSEEFTARIKRATEQPIEMTPEETRAWLRSL